MSKGNFEEDEESGNKTGTFLISTSGANYTYEIRPVSASGVTPAYTQLTMPVKFSAQSLMNRLYNPNSGEHFYTESTEEKEALVGYGWQAEGIGWVAPTTSTVPVFRLYNPNAGDHHYTRNANERDTLISVGWKDEGIGWYSATAATATAVPTSTIEVFREYNPNAKAAGAHNYTINEVENHALVGLGWIDEGIAWSALK